MYSATLMACFAYLQVPTQLFKHLRSLPVERHLESFGKPQGDKKLQGRKEKYATCQGHADTSKLGLWSVLPHRVTPQEDPADDRDSRPVT